MDRASNSEVPEEAANEYAEDNPQAEYEVVYAMSELRECPKCHGTCVEDQWDEDSPPCDYCWGAGEV